MSTVLRSHPPNPAAGRALSTATSGTASAIRRRRSSRRLIALRVRRLRRVRALGRAAQPLRPGDAGPDRCATAAGVDRRRQHQVPARHRRSGPRHPVGADVRLAHLAVRRPGVGAAVGVDRRRPGPAGGLRRRRDRRLHHARVRRDAVVPVDPGGAADRWPRARAVPQRARVAGLLGAGLRDRADRLGAVRAHGARLDDGRAQQGVRAGGAGDRRGAAARDVSPRAAQRARARCWCWPPSRSPARSSPRRR